MVERKSWLLSYLCGARCEQGWDFCLLCQFFSYTLHIVGAKLNIIDINICGMGL